ncbi:Aste57867_23544 [Aphanomyces stellatus]|uniref:Aste57867_23544 protein n=1 Tax=Aphanomyces stellatus TaxID=120398 RepID=A0A485LP13_9STRA|nr:hypothetical protein As57867_023473 [Aphanomyces stellatus]VFU00189.1 Aste57867_23544 [Aphanomyces stellatus]
MLVVPAVENPVVSKSTSRWRRNLGVALGCGYIVASMGTSVYYLGQLEPASRNDMLWADYSVNGTQALLVDLVNQLLATGTTTEPLDVLATSACTDKTYLDPASSTQVFPAYARRLVLADLTSLAYAVPNLRSLAGAASMNMPTQYCYVDLNRTFEVAHTEARQARCAAQYRDNGAVYMETVLRNQVWDDFMLNFGGDGGMFTITVETWLQAMPAGQVWLETTATARSVTSVDQEIAYWQRQGVTYFKLQWHNQWQTGIDESVAVENALGLPSVVLLKRTPFETTTFTSIVLNWMPFYDLYFLSQANRSLIRSANNSIAQPPAVDLQDYFFIQGTYSTTSGGPEDIIAVLQTHLGPFFSVDAFYMTPPAALIVFLKAFETSVFSDDKALGMLDAIPPTDFYPTPLSWSDKNASERLFYGGSPLCMYRRGLPFVQDSFGFADSCLDQRPLTVTVDKYSGLFAVLATGESLDVDATCALESAPACQSYLTRLINVAHSRVMVSQLTLTAAVDATVQLNISLVQVAANAAATNWTLLTAPILESSFAIFGWAAVHDWVVGQREVVSFQGDAGTLVLLSVADRPIELTSSATSVLSATRIVYVLVLYTVALLGLVALGCLVGVYVLPAVEVDGDNLFWFNRIVSSIWVGRPLVFVRGVSAILLLGTTRLGLVATHRTRFEFTRRSWLATCVVAGEATWALYAAQDFVTIVTDRRTTRHCTLATCVVAWVALVGLELVSPVQPTGFLDRQCSAINMDQTLACNGSLLQLGSLDRVCVILAILGGASIASIAMGTLCRLPTKSTVTSHPPRHLLGVADNYLATVTATPDATGQRRWALDKVACLMAGLVSLAWRDTHYTFDVKLWVLHRDKQHTLTRGSTMSFALHTQQNKLVRPAESTAKRSKTTSSSLQSYKRLLKPVAVGLGTAYAVGSIIGCVSYVQVSKVALANDLLWATFNMTGANAFLGIYLHSQLILGVDQTSFSLNSNWINVDGSFNTNNGRRIPTNVGGFLQHDSQLTQLEKAISGLRSTDGCAAPWIFTQYCYVDFDKRWEVANSVARQVRCLTMKGNGAVYLDSVLRNVPFDAFQACWGDAFDSAVASSLRETLEGREWVQTLSATTKLPVSDEAALWRSHNITTFATQWQNFKRIGLVHTYTVQTALATTYSFTIQHQESSFRLHEQTSFKMYWGLANDLWALAPGQNSSALSGQSLVRSSPRFAFGNASTPASLMIQNGTLVTPFASSLALIFDVLGPFGSIDMRFVPCPRVAKDAVRAVTVALRTTLAINPAAQVAYGQISDPSSSVYVAPQAWIDANFFTVGGDLLCPEVNFNSGYSIFGGFATLLSATMQCNSILITAAVGATRETLLASVVLANASASIDDVDRVCGQDGTFQTSCAQFLPQATAFVAAYMQLDGLFVQIQAANAAIQDTHVEVIQFGQDIPMAPVVLYRLPMLGPEYPDFKTFAWLFLIDWTMGFREAVSFQGDVGSISVLTEYATTHYQANSAEEPTTVAFYLRNTVLYITGMMIAIASIVLVYVGLSRGCIEVLNLLELQRVGAMVWIGRPLLVVRSLTAVALLSTSTLQLVFDGFLSSFHVVHDPWYKTVLAANEVTWLVAIVNDIAMAWTQEYTIYYATTNSLLVWLVVVALSFASPIEHIMTIAQSCDTPHVDLQVVCSSGTLAIGFVSRVATVVGVVLGCNIMCFVVARRVLGPPAPSKINSIFINAGAKYLFVTTDWIVDDVYYMDRVSAMLNGILTVRSNQLMLGIDIKLWRAFRVDLPPEMGASEAHAAAIKYGLPLPLGESV